MKTQALNLFIVDDDPLVVAGLWNDLNIRFGDNLNISTFYSGESALEQVDMNTSIIILDYCLDGENGNDVLNSIKRINPKTEVIMLSSSRDISVAIDSIRKGATDFVIKGDKAWEKITSLVYKTIIYPVQVMVREFGIHNYNTDFKKN